MSKKLKRAMMANIVMIRNKTGSEAMVWFRDRAQKRQTYVLKSNETAEIAPKLTDAKSLQWSNIEDLVKRGVVEVL